MYQKDVLPEHPFWHFVTRMHQQESTQSVLLQLQGYHEIQLNLLLFCCWFSYAGQGRLSRNDMQKLISSTTTWHQRIVNALNKLHLITRKSEIKEVLNKPVFEYLQLAEQIEQLMLTDVNIRFVRLSRTPVQKLIDACKNICIFLKCYQVPTDPVLCELLCQLLSLLFPSIELKEVSKACQTYFLQESQRFFVQRKLLLD